MEPGLSSPATFRFLPERPSDQLTKEEWTRERTASRGERSKLAGAPGDRTDAAAGGEQIAQCRARRFIGDAIDSLRAKDFRGARYGIQASAIGQSRHQSKKAPT